MSRQIATFCIGDLFLGIDILLIKEIYRKMALTPIPESTQHLRGLMNLRGKVVTVIDLNPCLGRGPSEVGENSRLLILKTDEEIFSFQHHGLLDNVKLGGDIVGFLIDQMHDVQEVADQDIHPPPSNIDPSQMELMEGVIKYGEKVVMLLDITAVLEKVMNATDE